MRNQIKITFGSALLLLSSLFSIASFALDRTIIADAANNVTPLLVGQILAISPETPAQLQAQKLQSKFSAQLLSDSKLNAIRGFGIGYYVADETTAKYKSKKNIDLNASDTSGKAVLPAPAVFILDEQGRIKFSYVNPDFKQRLAPELLYQAAKYSL